MKLIIKSKPEHFYRAGMKFTRQPVEVDVDDKTAKRLIAEPMLIVENVCKPASLQTDEAKDEVKIKEVSASFKLNAKKRK
jgi:hypothetical protein